ncbi:MAG: FtsX-like permease family protein [Candidatus Thiodiazotropha lotti]|uniref:ABC transporter permease n=1 Tax=Candidatus Thiodiazotropha endoloripes TaxID=1818881 RepID=A0A1E2ULG7_9GAMM|nr:FtsX-like permease family protein [Candidatus Thiodiazotropha endoloripes]MCG7898636.1 FtsX-like permease family protein [Candidatus Thiodiazotropha weberae]MCG7991942.1 FtsX-like permease family protein [Candidatus Thiodiazotropha lotti]MCG7901980.1 FtsX-like permease family protein [Candidatus Thiodiazotropha weberae]MCG7914901.1 FtsX-like permease family protein [Candidatus Thiodiazotropha weberae]MCG7998446.1 FtsX-like permease family protein [Candidatus Thiodiazotropha lotti]
MVSRLGILTYVALAVRNLVRNRRRTTITLLTMMFGIATLTLLSALNDGWLSQMKTNFILSFTGHLQIHAKGFEASQNLRDNIADPDTISRYMDTYPEIIGWTQRIRTSGLASVSGNSTGVQIMAADPEQETWVTSMDQNVKTGVWLRPGMNKDLLLGKTVAQNLGAKLSDRVILMTQRPSGEMISEVYYLRGIIETGAPQIDRTLALISLDGAQQWLQMQQAVTDIVIRADHHDQTDTLYRLFVQQLSEQVYEIMPWQELDPMVRQWLEFSDAYGLIILFVVILLVLTEILNTMLISLHERQKELGVMIAIGTQPHRIFLMLLFEAVLLIFVGALLGYLIASLVVMLLADGGIDLTGYANAFEFFYMDPVIHPQLTRDSAVKILLATLVAALLAGIYPAWKATRLSVSQALRIQ